MIDFSLGLRSCNPGDADSPKKAYAYSQARQILNIMTIGRHIQQHGSVYTRDVVVGVLTKAVDCIREELLNGNKVNLGELGSFYVTLSSEGVDNVLDFNPDHHITSVNVRWEPGESFRDLLPDADFHYVTTREQQAVAKKTEKEALNLELGYEPISDNGGSNSGSGNSTGGNTGGNSGGGGNDDNAEGQTE